MAIKSFILHQDYAGPISELTDEEAGKLFKALLNYAGQGEEPELEGSLYAVFLIIRNQIDRDAEKYEKKCERLRKNGSKGGRPSGKSTPEGNQEPEASPEEPNENTEETGSATDPDEVPEDPSPEDPEKTGKSDSQAYTEIIQYLNDKTGKKFRASTPKTRTAIHARMAEGFKVEDFKSVIDIKCADWIGDQKMEKFLRPETLFGTKFEGYLNEQAKTERKDSNGEASDPPIRIGKYV